MTISNRIAKIMLYGGVAAAALIYLAFFNTLSETDMVNFSYIWLPFSVAGAAVLFTGNNTVKNAIIWFVVTLLALFIFFQVIFPML